ncbi:MAG: adenine deaminase [Flavisolibacter sp.]
MSQFTVEGNLVDILRQEIYPASIQIKEERIVSIDRIENVEKENMPFILPGFIDAHVHIESSMLVPTEFARLAVAHGTVATVSDPHEIANVCGMEGIDFMRENGKQVPFKFYFGAPSCVPATKFETSGATLTLTDISTLLKTKELLYLSEMMDFPGVLNHDGEIEEKISIAKKYNKPIDGHAPGLVGEMAKKYIDAGISTDHECFTREEAFSKLQYGMKIIIREGSAAKNFDALIELLHDYEDQIMFCSDDKHPDSLVEGHINSLCARAVSKGINLFKVLKAACVNPVKHYKLKVGQLRKNDFADFVLVKDLKTFEIVKTYINGQLVAENGKTKIMSLAHKRISFINNFSCTLKQPKDFHIPWNRQTVIPVIEALDGQLITNNLQRAPKVFDGNIVADVEKDILKIAVVNRYKKAPIALGFIKNFGLKNGALASSVAHDSHNIVAVGSDDENLCGAINKIIASKGGISCYGKEAGGEEKLLDLLLALPIGGLMSAEDGYEIAKKYSSLDEAAKQMGSSLQSPFMTLSFMALLVIPHLKMSDMGLFDSDAFCCYADQSPNQ